VREVSHASPLASDPALVVISRYRITDRAEFARQARAALAILAESDGWESGSIAQSTDETDLVIITTRWRNVGAYRRALSRPEVKMSAVPLLSTAVDESTAFEIVHERSGDLVIDSASGRAADADTANLGEAAARNVPGVHI
jgi:hypothetical protein